MSALIGLLALLVVGANIFYLACIWFTLQFFRQSRPMTVPIVQDVSILVPICGLDEGAWDNWLSLCQQACDRYEVLFGVVDPQDPAVPVLQHLQAKFSDRVRVLTGLTPRGANHKDSTLSYLLEVAQFDWLILADSDIRVAPDYIQTVVGPLVNGKVDMITCAFIARSPQYFWAAIASLGRCCDFIPSALIARSLDGGLRFAIGMTMALHRSTLEAAGGLHLNRIGSDYNLGKRVAQAGYRVELSHLIMESDTGRETAHQLYQRELRWSRTIRFNRGMVYYTLIVCYGSLLTVPLLAIAADRPWVMGLCLVTWLIRYSQATIAILAMDALGLLRWLWALPIRDTVSLVVWGMGCLGRRVLWRGRHLTIRGDGLIHEASH